MIRLLSLGVLLGGLVVTGCTGTVAGQQNPYLTLSETFGITSSTAAQEINAAGGSAVAGLFRLPLTVTIANNHSFADVDTAFIAWVEAGNVRTTEQEDALFHGGYIQLADEVRVGTAFVLPVGTFVYGGEGVGGATTVRLGSPGSSALPNTLTVSLITPDGFLLFSQPPTSCESAAFAFTRDGEPLTAVPVADAESPFGGANRTGGIKTLAQVNLYQCSPLRPGLFLRVGGITDVGNEYLEGATIRFDLNETPDDNGDFAIVTIS
jgi:hypothetical protein